MKIASIVLASILFFAGSVLTYSQSFAQETCGEASTLYKLKINISKNKPDSVKHNGKDARELHVCNGDKVEWKIVGSGKKYWVDFLNAAPFTGDRKKNSNENGKILVVINGDTRPEGYKYDIGLIGGGVMDPRIVIGN